jgi:hypothetical protein
VPREYIRRDAEFARGHRWYMTARLVTLYDIYFLDGAPATGTGRRKPEQLDADS